MEPRHMFVPSEELDGWAERKRSELRYATGEAIELGDMVDFGFESGALFEATSADWPGDVVGFRGVLVLVDTHLNEIRAFEAGELRLLERKDETDADKQRRAEDALARGEDHL